MIDRCICRNITFKEILSLLEGEKDFDIALQKVQFGDKCKFCHPYVMEMLKTEKTNFPKPLKRCSE